MSGQISNYDANGNIQHFDRREDGIDILFDRIVDGMRVYWQCSIAQAGVILGRGTADSRATAEAEARLAIEVNCPF